MALPVLGRNPAVEQKGQSARGWKAPVGRWSPWAEFIELHDRMGRLLSEAFGDAHRPGGEWRPAADVEETAEAYVVELELAGVKRKDVSVALAAAKASRTAG